MVASDILGEVKSALMKRINTTLSKAYEYSQEFMIYSNLWADDQKVCIEYITVLIYI